MKKIFLIVILIFVLLFSISYAKNFSDVNASFWAYGPINEMLNDGILSGYPDGTFRPNNAITRAEFAKILVSSLNLKQDSITSKATFEDVKSDFWAYDYIKTASKYMSGYDSSNGKKKYEPNQHAIREDVAFALVLATGLDKSEYNLSVLDKFKDKASISSSNRKYIAIAVEKNLIKGFDDGTFKPSASLTRAQVSQLIYNTKPLKQEQIQEGFEFNDEDLTIDLGPNWEKYVVGFYRASQRHLIYSSESNGYEKYKNETDIRGIDEFGKEYSKFYDIDNTFNGNLPYYNVDDKETHYFKYDVPFTVEIPLTNTNGERTNNPYSAVATQGDIVEIKYKSHNKIKQAVATFYYGTQYGSKDVIFKQYLNTNNVVVIPEFRKKDYMYLEVQLIDEYGNKYTKACTLFNKDLLKYNGDFYSVLSDGIYEEKGIKKIKMSNSATVGQDSTFVISNNCKIDDSLLSGKLLAGGRPIFVFARIDENRNVVQLIPISNYEFLYNYGTYGNTFYAGDNVTKVNATDIDNNLNQTVYKIYDKNYEEPISTINAKKWMCAPTYNGTAGKSVQFNGFSNFARTYAFTYNAVEAWIVENNKVVTYFMVANYSDGTEENEGEMYQSEEFKFIKEDLTINLGKNFEDYTFTSLHNTYSPSQRVLVYNGYYKNGKTINSEKHSNPKMSIEGSRQLLTFLGNESSTEEKTVIIHNTKTQEQKEISIPNPFRVIAKINNKEIYSGYAKMYGDTEEKRNHTNLANEKDKVTFEFDILNGLKEAKFIINNYTENKVEYSTTNKTYSFNLPEFIDSDIVTIRVEIIDKQDNAEVINYSIINKQIYELKGDFYVFRTFGTINGKDIILDKDKDNPVQYKINDYTRIPVEFDQNQFNLEELDNYQNMVGWIAFDSNNKVGAIIPIQRIYGDISDYGTYYTGPNVVEIAADYDLKNFKEKQVYSKYDEERQYPIDISDAKIYTVIRGYNWGKTIFPGEKWYFNYDIKSIFGYIVYDENNKKVDRVYFLALADGEGSTGLIVD